MSIATHSTPHTDQIRRMLGEAPVGHHPLLEAGFAWHERRRPGRGAPLTPARPAPGQGSTRYLPIMVTHSPAASRLARLLSTVTWAIATPLGDDPAERHAQANVEVPAESYDRVVRTLNAAWRDRWRHLNANGTGPDSESRHAARAVWRIAVLVGGHWREDGFTVRVSTPLGFVTLTVAAQTLGLTVASTGRRPGSTILLPDCGQLSYLRDNG